MNQPGEQGPCDATDDNERILRKFDKVFTLFCNPEVTIEDDTIPDRLLSCICEMLTLMSQNNGAVSLQEFLHLDGVNNLIMNAPLCHQNKKIVAFTLKVYSLLGKIKGGYQLIRENGSLKKAFAGCCRSDMFLDATVREAWFAALEILLTHHHEALELVVEIGGIDKLMKSLTDPSMFVSKSAIKLLKKILQCLEEMSSQKNDAALESQGKLLSPGGIVSELFGLLANAVQEKDVSVSTAMLNTLSDICITEVMTKCFFSHDQHVILLTQCLEDASLIKPASELLMKGMEHTNTFLPSPLPTLLADSSECLVKLHKLDDALRTAAKLLVVSESRHKSIYQNQRFLLRYPMKLLRQDLSNGSVDPLQEYFNGKSIFRKATLSLLCRCKDLMKNNPEVEPILTLSELHTVLAATLTSGIPISTKWSQFLHGSVQIQKVTLDYLKLFADQKTDCAKDDVEKTVAVLVGILESADTDTGVMVKSLDTLLAFCTSTCMLAFWDPFPNLGRLMQKLMCDVRWEVRDSALTFVAGVSASNSEKSIDWILEHNLQQFVIDGIKDGDSYVRATALSSVQQIISCRQLLKTADQLEQLIDATMDIITNDTEGFPRRSAMSLLCHLSKADFIPEALLQKTYSCVASARNDFDWEVKLHAINFWENVIAKTMLGGGGHLRNGNEIPSYAQTLFQNSSILTADNDCDRGNVGTGRQKQCLEKLQSLQSNHCLESLLSSADDYDQSVKSKACGVLLDLRTECESQGLSPDFIDTELGKIGVPKPDDTVILDNSVSFSSDSVMDSQTFSVVKVNVNSTCELLSQTLQTLSILFNLDLDTLMKQSQQTTDEYVSNPESLLDDIIAWSTESEDILVDCY